MAIETTEYVASETTLQQETTRWSKSNGFILCDPLVHPKLSFNVSDML